MITKNDCLELVWNSAVENKIELFSKIQNASLKEAIQELNKARLLELSEFFEYLRKQHNSKKKRKVYIGLVEEDLEPDELAITMSAYLTQVFLYDAKNKETFLKHSYAKEVTTALYKLVTQNDSSTLIKIRDLIKTDIKFLDLRK